MRAAPGDAIGMIEDVPAADVARWCMGGGYTMDTGLRVALIGAIVASAGNQITFARAQTTAPTAAQR